MRRSSFESVCFVGRTAPSASRACAAGHSIRTVPGHDEKEPEMSRSRGFVALALALCLATGSLGCPREQGPLEKAGEQVDDAIDEITHPNEGPLEEAGRKVDESLDE
jgi:hypothetical protein